LTLREVGPQAEVKTQREARSVFLEGGRRADSSFVATPMSLPFLPVSGSAANYLGWRLIDMT